MSDDDAYLKSLEDRGKDISRREDSLTKQEKTVSVQRAQITAERAAWEAAFANYREFLQSQGKQAAPLFTTNDAKPETSDFTSVNLRVGEQRGKILLFIAKQSEAGRKVTTREILEGTGLNAMRVSNVIWTDCNRGFLDRVGNHIVMTPKGLEFVRQAGVYNVASQTGVTSASKKN